jgi:hypothetical protein
VDAEGDSVNPGVPDPFVPTKVVMLCAGSVYMNEPPETPIAVCCANIPLAEVSYGVTELRVSPEVAKVTVLAELFELIATISDVPLPV